MPIAEGIRPGATEGETPMPMQCPITVGSRVAYSAAFLRSLAIWSGPAPQLRGQVEALEPFGERHIALVSWDDGTSAQVLTPNLTLEARIGADATLADRIR